MINLENASVSKCIIHRVGNSYVGDRSEYSENEIILNEYEMIEIKNIFTKHFKTLLKSNKFCHSIDLNQNVIYKLSEGIFDSNKNFIRNTKNIVKYLFEQTTHYSIRSGEVFILKFQDVMFNNTISDAIGIFKIETPTNFIKPDYDGNSINIFFDKGIIGKNIEKGCLIFNTDYHDGYVVYSFEKNSTDTNYWNKNFLSIKTREDDFNSTNSLLESYREFIIHDLPDKNISKKDKINLINKSIDFVMENQSSLSVTDFIKSNLPDKQNQKLYKDFLNTYAEANEIDISNTFQVSPDAIKFQKGKFKSIIKLDRNFHIYIHGDENLIENGVDKNGRKFYKIYYDNEL